jgi:Fe-S cluster biogenesis protein NfuA
MGSSLNIHPKYQKAAAAFMANLRHEGVLVSDVPRAIAVVLKGATLSATIDGNGVVREAKHSGAKGAHQAILEGICTLAPGRTLREISEHGMIYLENQMRDPKVSHPIKGLLTPENADPAFELPLALTRSLYEKYTETAGRPKGKNFWSPKPRAEWAALSAEEQQRRIETALTTIAPQLNLGTGKVEVVEVRALTRVVASISGFAPGPAVGSTLMKIERLLQQMLEPQLELILESLEDKNKRIGRTHIPRTQEVST